MSATKLWYPFHIERYRRKTRHLTVAEHGAYRLLMDAYWDNRGPLPADETRLRKMIGADSDEWALVRDAVLAFFELTDDGWRHDTIDEQIAEAVRQHEAKKARIAFARSKRSVSVNVKDNTDDNLDDKPDCKIESRLPSPSPSLKYEVPKSTRARFGEEFWEKYPHPPNRGDKHGVIKKINALPDDEQQQALNSLAVFRKIIDDQRRKIHDYQAPMASTFVNQRRWEAIFESTGNGVPRETSIPDHDDPQCAELWKSLRASVGDAALSAWFVIDGKPCLRKNCEGFVIEANATRADRINQQFAPRLNDILGKKNWRIEPPAHVSGTEAPRQSG